MGFNKPKMDSLLDVLAAKNKGMGSFAISKQNQLLYTRAIGFAENTPKMVNASPETKYRVGSISKTFTSVLILQLVEAKKLTLLTKLSEFFPEVPNASKITISDMLTHRSGIYNFTNDENYLTWAEKPQTQAEMLKRISGYKSDFPPNTKTDYSNANYVLLGYIAEKLTKKSYKTLIDEKICQPLGLKSTYAGGKISVANGEARSFQMLEKWENHMETDMSVPAGAGAIVSTPSDLCRFIEGLFAEKLISGKMLNEMIVQVEGMGMGIFTFPYNGRTSYGHTGGIDGFSSMLGYFPAEKMAIAYVSNGTVYGVNDIMLGGLSSYFGDDFKIPTFESKTLSVAELDQYVGVYASAQIPIKITVSRKNTTLYAQATGQAEFPLDAKGEHKFVFDGAKLEMIFVPEKGEFTLLQGGGKFLFKK